MPQHPMRLQSANGTSIVYVDPNDFRSTVKVDVKTAVKRSTNGATLYNARSNLKTVRAPVITIAGCVDKCVVDRENVSISTAISGSVENKALVALQFDDHIASLIALRDDFVSGLLPADFIPNVTTPESIPDVS